MRILREPLDSISANDIAHLCTDEVSEGTEIELKADLPFKGGKGGPPQDPWHTGGSFGEFARNQIAEEIVAFANTLGGVVCVGINETQDHPKRAATPNPLPRVHELARRLRQAVYDVIDPPLPILEARGIELNSKGEGVVLIRTPPSRRRPHRHAVNKEVFIRRADESAKVSMREIHELTMQAVSEATRIEATIEGRRQQFRGELEEWLHQERTATQEFWGVGLHLFALPTVPLDLGRVVGRGQLINLACSTTAIFGTDHVNCAWPAHFASWRPGLRQITSEDTRKEKGANFIHAMHTLRTSGECEISLKFKATNRRPGVFVGWMLGGLGKLFTWIERVRREAGTEVEFAVAVMLPIRGRPVALVEYGATDYVEGLRESTLPVGVHEFPLMSIGLADEYPMHLQRFDEDIWNLAGEDVRTNAPKFELGVR
jgi:schlafen family protein